MHDTAKYSPSLNPGSGSFVSSKPSDSAASRSSGAASSCWSSARAAASRSWYTTGSKPALLTRLTRVSGVTVIRPRVPAAVVVGAADRVPGQPPGQRPDPRPGPPAAGGRSAGHGPLAGLGEGAPGGPHRRGVPGIEPEDLIRGVQGHRAQLPGVAGREHLGEPAAVGIAVQVHPAQPQGVQHPGHVPGRVGRVEQVGGVHPAAVLVMPGVIELRAAGRDQLVEVATVLFRARVLEPGAIHRGGRAGPAQVDQQQVAGRPQPAGHRQVLGFRAGGGVPGAAFHGQDRPGGLTGRRQPAEAHLDPGAGRGGVVQRYRQAPAVGERLRGAPAQGDAAHPQAGHAAGGGRADRRRRRGAGGQYHQADCGDGGQRGAGGQRDRLGHAAPQGSHQAIVPARPRVRH